MKKQLITTADGSKTIHFPEWNESYHSKHGAILEAQHVYIKSGLDYRGQLGQTSNLKVLEFGFGTGLNTLLSLIYATDNQINVTYHGIEKYPLNPQLIRDINYSEILKSKRSKFDILHEVEWETASTISDTFQLKKIKSNFQDFQSEDKYDVIFFDAFGPRVQPELWEKPLLEKCYHTMSQNGVWVTYSCKGSVRRNLKELGFEVEKITGPPGKREMLRAVKI